MAKRKTTTTKKPAVKRNIAADDLSRLILVGDPQISPAGGLLLFTRKHVGEKNNYVSNLWAVAVDSAGNDAPRQFTSGEKDSHGRFSPDGKTVAFISGRDDDGGPQIYTVSLSGGEAVALTDFPEGSVGDFRWSPDGRMLAVRYREKEADCTKAAEKRREETGESLPPRVIDDLYYRLDGDGYFNDRRHALYIVDVSTGEHRVAFDRDALGFFEYDWSPDSTELAVTANVSKDPFKQWWREELFRVDAASGRAKKVPDVPVGHKGTVRWSPDGKRIAYVGREGKEVWGSRNSRLYVCNPDGGNVRDLTGGEDYCPAGITISDTSEAHFGAHIVWAPDSKRVFMNFAWQGGTHVVSIAADGGNSDAEVVFHTEGRRVVSLGNITADGRRAALTAADQLRPAEVAVGEFNSGGKSKPATLEITRRTEFNHTLLDGLELSPAEEHWVESTDGVKVHTWVMKPPGFQKSKKYPAVLEVHGGPHCQYGETFFHEFQVLAANGYVVVYSNPRGSKGYGEDHCHAIKGDWGKADWADVQAVTKFMRGLPFVDSKRMGVMGGSYGGYMTNWAIGHTDEFAGAITDRCVANLVSMVGSSDIPLVPGEYWDGNSWDDTEELWNQSPLKYFGNVKTPTLVIHSEGDLRCNVEQGEQVFAALKLLGAPTRFVRYPRTTSHGLSRCGPPDLRLHRLEQILSWWKRWLR